MIEPMKNCEDCGRDIPILGSDMCEDCIKSNAWADAIVAYIFSKMIGQKNENKNDGRSVLARSDSPGEQRGGDSRA